MGEVDYDEYINSIGWKIKSRLFIAQRGYKCQVCGRSESRIVRLFTHHIHYRTLGNERPQDVQVLCYKCHAEADNYRREHRCQTAYQAGLDTWASNQYGDDWRERQDAWRIEKQFCEWIQFEKDY